MSYNYKGISNTTQSRSKVIQPFCYWNNAFSDQELSNIEALMNKTPLVESKVSGGSNGQVATEIRRSKVSFHTACDENFWIFDRINGIVDNLNSRFYNFDINGYDNFQYSEYHSENKGAYDWHMDTYIGLMPEQDFETRKLSLVLWLNDDYDGGDFEITYLSFKEPLLIPKEKGKLILFPSFLFHRVTPVTSGVRKSLVSWITGPKFR